MQAQWLLARLLLELLLPVLALQESQGLQSSAFQVWWQVELRELSARRFHLEV